MSVVTNTILATRVFDLSGTGSTQADPHKVVSQLDIVNEFFTNPDLRDKYRSHDKSGFRFVEDMHVGGSKYLECELAIGAFNYLNLEGLILYLRTLKWKSPESVQLMVRKDQADRFELINVFEDLVQ
jgi:hypothetical protein